MHTYIVTGGAGLIGATLVAELNRRGEEDILVVDHLNHPGKEANLRRLRYRGYLDKHDFREALRAGTLPAASTLFHLGACSATTEMRESYLDDNNTRCTQELCEWALERNVRFIYASSAATYGDGQLGYDDAEGMIPRLHPLNLYGWSKQKFDAWAMERGHFGRIAGLKYFNVFGPGEEHKGEMRSVIHKAHEQILRTGRVQLFRSHRPDYADGEQDRDFVWVEDAVRMTLHFHDHPGVSGIFNCGTGKARTWRDLACAIFAAMGRDPRIEFVDMPGALRDKYQYHTQARTEKLRAAGAPLPDTPLEEAVSRYVREWLAKPEEDREFAGAGPAGRRQRNSRRL